MPSYLPVTTESANYAPAVFCGFVALAAGWYWAWGKEHYQGPPAQHPVVG